MNKLTKKRMIILTGLFLTGCCQDYIYIPDDVDMRREQQRDYYHESQYLPRRHVVTHKKQPKVYVVNNTPHIKKQPLNKGYHEGRRPADVGLVDMNGELL